MKFSAAAATVLAVAIAAFALAVAHQTLLPPGADLFPIPRIGQGEPDVVVVDTGGRTENAPGAGSGSGDSAEAPAEASADSAPGVAPDGVTAPPDLPAVLTGSGYVEQGRVVLSLGSIGRDGAEPVVERSLAALSGGSCGEFGPWLVTSSSATLPHGTCALYRVLLDGEVVYVLPEEVRYDATRPETPELHISEDGQREFVSGSTLYVAAGGGPLRAVTVSATTTDPESGISDVSFENGNTEIQVSDNPWTTEFSPVPGSVTVTAENRAGEVASADLAVVADADGPSDGSISYSASAVPGESVEISVDAGVDAGAGVDTASIEVERSLAVLSDDGCGSFDDWTQVASRTTAREGTCARYRVRVRDHVANETIYRSETIMEVADETTPLTTVTSPAPGAVLAGVVTVTASAEDAGSGLRSVRIQVARCAGGSWTELETTARAPYSASWDTRTLEAGSYLLRSVATDRAGNSSTSEPVRVVVAGDATPPTVSILAPVSGVTLSGLTTVSARADDPESGIRSLTIEASGEEGGWVVLGTFDGEEGSATWDTTSLESDGYLLRAVATNGRGQETVSEPVRVFVDLGEDPIVPPEPPADDPPAEEPVDDTPVDPGSPGEPDNSEEPPVADEPNEAPSTPPDDSAQPDPDEEEAAEGADGQGEDAAEPPAERSAASAEPGEPGEPDCSGDEKSQGSGDCSTK